MPRSDTPPLVSVVIPAFNSADVLGESVESALQSPGVALEVIVIDDGSTDRTPDILRPFSDRIRIVHQANGGLGAARNRGHAEARGALVAWLDADDVAAPDRFRIQAEVMARRPDIDLLSTAFSAFDANGEISPSFAEQYYGALSSEGLDILFSKVEPCAVGGERSVALYAGKVYPRLAYGNFVHPPTVMMRREVWQRAGPLDSQFLSATDWEFFVRASRTATFGYLDLPLLRYRRSEAQMTSDGNRARNVVREMRALDRILAADPKLWNERARVRALYRYFHLTLAESTAATARGAALRSLLRSLRFGFEARRFAPAAMRVVTPNIVIPLLRAARATARRHLSARR